MAPSLSFLMKISPVALEAQEFSKDRFLFFIFIFCIFLFLIESSLILTSFGKLPPQVPIFFSLPWGNSYLAPTIFLWLLPAISFLVFILNSFVSLFFLENDKFLKRVIFCASLLLVFACFYNLVKIVTLLI